MTVLAAPFLEACAALLFQTVLFAFLAGTLVVAVLAYAVGMLIDLGVHAGA